MSDLDRGWRPVSTGDDCAVRRMTQSVPRTVAAAIDAAAAEAGQSVGQWLGEAIAAHLEGRPVGVVFPLAEVPGALLEAEVERRAGEQPAPRLFDYYLDAAGRKWQLTEIGEDGVCVLSIEDADWTVSVNYLRANFTLLPREVTP